MAWKSGALVGEIVSKVEKTVRLYRNVAFLTANLPANTVMNLEKGRLKFLYPEALLRIAGAAAKFVEKVNIAKLPVSAIPLAEAISSSVNELSEESLQEALLAAKKRG